MTGTMLTDHDHNRKPVQLIIKTRTMHDAKGTSDLGAKFD